MTNTRKRLDEVEVGQRYVLKVPRSLKWDHQLRGLRDKLREWLDDKPHYLDDEDHSVEVDGVEPVWLFNHPVVTVRGTTQIEPLPSHEPYLDEHGNPDLDVNGEVMMMEVRTPLEEPEPAVVIHLARMPLHPKATVLLTDDQVAKLGLEPDQG